MARPPTGDGAPGLAGNAARRVQPETLNVAPALLDLPLASPARRAGAMALDLAAVTLLFSLANVWLLAGLGVLLLRRLRAESRAAMVHTSSSPPVSPTSSPSASPSASPAPRPPISLPWRLLATALLLVGLWQGIAQWRSGHGAEGDDDAGSADVEAAVESAVESLRAGASWPQAVASAADTARRGASAPARTTARTTAPITAPVTTPATPATPATAVAAASAPGASPQPVPADISPREAGYRAAAVVLERQVDSLKQQLAQARSETPWDRARRLLRELGLGYGGALLYFTLLPLVWPGQTPGKRLLGLRVVELTGAPMTAMLALRRYGGYAAGLATGGLGLLQLLWDRNRQAIQDRCAHTVVVDLRRG